MRLVKARALLMQEGLEISIFVKMDATWQLSDSLSLFDL